MLNARQINLQDQNTGQMQGTNQMQEYGMQFARLTMYRVVKGES